MRKQKVSKIFISALLLAVTMAGCGDADKNAAAGNPSDPLTPPTVTSVTPPDASTGVCPNTALITATFSKAMNPATINSPATTFTLTAGGTSVSGTVSIGSTGLIATFTPSSPLTVNTAYTATITTGVHDTFGNPLAANKVWTFTTATVACPGSIAFVTPACGFGILAGSTVTNVAGTPTTVSGDVGVSPGTAITGFGAGSGTITGMFHAGDATAAAAQGQLTTAYNAAASAAAGGTILSADIGGQTLPPGAYRTTSAQPTLGITGTLTLDGQGNPNSVFIIHVESALTTASSSKVLLIGGAQAKNVFWQIGSSATLGTSSVFTGNIMALASITVTTGTALNGRALARNGAVTMDTNTVVVPPC